MLAGQHERLGAVAGQVHLVAVAGQQRLEVREVVVLVVDAEDPGHEASAGSASAQIWRISSMKVSGSMGFSM